MKSKRETLILIAILVGFLFLGSTLGAFLFKETRTEGDPKDVSRFVSKEEILSSESPSRGAQNPRFTLVEFGDFQCGSCGVAEPLLADLLKQRSDVRLVFRHFPMVHIHEFAEAAARASEVARLSGKFWEMHDALYVHQPEWTRSAEPASALRRVAVGIGLDGDRFLARLQSLRDAEVRAHIDADIEAGKSSSIKITPCFFLITPTRIWAAVGPIGLKRLMENGRYWN